MVFVERHVLLLDASGKTVVDTDSRIRDRRKVKNVVLVFKPAAMKQREERTKQAVLQWLRDRGDIPPGFNGDEKLVDLDQEQLARVIAWKKQRKEG